MLIRKECSQDTDAIRKLIFEAFKGHPHHEPGTDPTEHLIPDRLRREDALTLSLVAEREGELIGHLALSPIQINGCDSHWLGLAPLAVIPEHQGKGVGTTLIQSAVAEARQLGVQGIVVLGEPAYYGKFGFQARNSLRYPGIPAQYFMALPLGSVQAEGQVSYHPAFH